MLVPVSGVERSSDAGAWAVLTLSGEIDVDVVPRLREAVDELVAEGRVHAVWDLRDVSFMDSAGLGVLVYTMRSMEVRDGGFRLAAAGDQVCRLLELTGMDAVVERYPNVASATGQVSE